MHDMDIETVDGRKSRSMNDYLECIAKFQYGVEVGYREELIRCKDCKWFSEKGFCKHPNGGAGNIRSGNWYCADGEPKEQEIKQVGLYGKEDWLGLVCVCPDCQAEWMGGESETHFCPNCGRPVKWIDL